MADSLRDQLLKSGIVKQVQQDKRQAPAGRPAHKKNPVPPPARKRQAPSGDPESIDLARAYAIRAQAEASERKRAEREAAEQARLRRERKQQIQQLLSGNTLNKADADQPRNFEHGGKIRRIYVDAAQLAALNAGELGVVQQGGRYLLVSRDVAEQVRGIDARQLVLLIDPQSGTAGDDGVPDDLMW